LEDPLDLLDSFLQNQRENQQSDNILDNQEKKIPVSFSEIIKVAKNEKQFESPKKLQNEKKSQ